MFVGRYSYQFIPDTLDSLTKRMDLTGDERFTPQMQDRMALLLARDAGVNDWAAGQLNDARFAANLAKTWAGLPADASNQSAYEGDGRNHATIGFAQVVGTLGQIRGRA